MWKEGGIGLARGNLSLTGGKEDELPQVWMYIHVL